MSLSDTQLDRYARQMVLREIGAVGQLKLRDAHAVLIGAGGIGSPAALYLAAAGIGRITLIDDDKVSLANLQRQILFATVDVDAGKAETARSRLTALNPDVEITIHATRIDAANAANLLAGADVVVDGSDNFATRLAVADAAYGGHIPLVSAAIGQFNGQLGTFRGWEDGMPCYRCYVGDAFDAEDCDNCAELGVLGAMTGWLGSMAALDAIRTIHLFGEDQAGKLHLVDGLAPSLRTVRLPKDPGCKTCGQKSGTHPAA
ncbi:Molybdopterin-synthase adenylyltransferase [Sphingomonas antarctica]|uniref:HesA/MoeB/ThiF family protein n=1 Tax=Sphingomonas antarctica TaxID=2040274 RepID=UPI0039EA506E